ncbi:unnamed protein product [Didymodactylos carnosus]|uniref:Uncharacterized protein n=1 Tax=Didymodactylos carnosus TaxID=1234261 RepID=A0A814XBG5_9BILA|nr:unnamed protein product [Didymodactylos carnosus]CAF3977377.1 unnamed protein product [Didymodactylos carnosus]
MNLTPISDYRKQVIRTIQNNLHLKHDISSGNVEQYIHDLQQEGTYGSETELNICAYLNQIEYHVLHLNDNNEIGGTSVHGNNVRCAYLLFDKKRNHYDPLYFAKTDNTIETIVQRNDEHIYNIIKVYIQETNLNAYNEAIQTSEPLRRWEKQNSCTLDYGSNNITNMNETLSGYCTSDYNDGNREAVDNDTTVGIPTDQEPHLHEVIGHKAIMLNVQEEVQNQIKLSMHANPVNDTSMFNRTEEENGQYLITKPEIIAQPAPFYHKRYPIELSKCPCIQSGSKQRSHPQTTIDRRWRDDYGEELYMCVQLCKHNGDPHPYKLIPDGARIDNNLNLIIECCNVYYHKESNLLYFKIVESDFENQVKSYLMKFVALKQNTYEITKQRIKREKLKLSKIGFTLCQKQSDNTYRQLSETSYSTLIEEGRKLKLNNIPSKICARGGEKIVISFVGGPLDKDVKLLLNHKLARFERKHNTIEFISISKSTNMNSLNIMITQENLYFEVIPGETERKIIVNTSITYIPHEKHPDHLHQCNRQQNDIH